MDLWQILILGIVEGFTEFLPISSTAHLALLGQVFKISPTEFFKSFEIAIQLGAILAVVIIYRRLLNPNNILIKKILTAFLPTAVIGLALYKIVKNLWLGNPMLILGALFIGGIIIIFLERLLKNKVSTSNNLESISYRQALIIGIIQSLAIIPGVSRAAATIFGGLFLGLNRKTIVEFSFLLAIPTMLAATGLDLLKNGGSFSVSEWQIMGLGGLVAFLSAWTGVKFILKYIQNHSFVNFGIYRLLLAIVFFWWIL